MPAIAVNPLDFTMIPTISPATATIANAYAALTDAIGQSERTSGTVPVPDVTMTYKQAQALLVSLGDLQVLLGKATFAANYVINFRANAAVAALGV
jgi:hypothetical protein